MSAHANDDPRDRNGTRTSRGLLERLESGTVICAEGYLFELERRGYLQAGTFVPEVVLEHPGALAQFHRELVRAGSDVIEAFTYYAHREKLRLIGKEHLLEPMNRRAIELAHEVAAEFPHDPPLVAGNLANTNTYRPDDPRTAAEASGMFAEQARWAAEGGVDYLIGETFYYAHEAELALEAMSETGLPAVVTFGLPATGVLLDDIEVEAACVRLAERGAAVVGLNCFRGFDTILPALRGIRAAVDVPVAALPVPYRTTAQQPTFFTLRDSDHAALGDGRPFPLALEPFQCNRFEAAAFADTAREAGISYLGLCCGAAPHHIRAMAEALGRTRPASSYAPDMSKHFAFGTDPSLASHHEEVAASL
ncbi:homocysteine S-methyltransferase family protein [Egibacter rhizosphaerae]|uniref:Homocysteine S-methyltransferase family protein n=1 Tax=Egibacter rhizosphaerae TaxID=1670831 RepID=A0A411YCZ5_9ACTN|nr:homocysteine S-methyltransferase family protein [Egibacter rhizosphaerae]QBI19070.1 homocysteine S-methyltransferase family protein [Egibacter rhizosphaerae]